MPNLAQPITLEFIFETIAVILALTAIGIVLVRLKKEV